jgi:AAA domain
MSSNSESPAAKEVTMTETMRDLGGEAQDAAAGFPTFADEDHDPLPREWNWAGRLPRGKVVIIAGWREAGKGLVGWNLTAALTNGWLLPGEAGDPERIAAGLPPKEPATVIGIWDEDDPNEDGAWRARAAGADLSRVVDLTTLPGGSPFELSAARGDNGDLPALLGAIRTLRQAGRNPRLVIMDPLDNLVMNGSHMSKQGATRLIRRLEFVARRTGVTVLVFHHLVEDGKAGKVGGSSKIVDVPRWVYRIERDEEAPELMILRKHKGNSGDPEDIRYRVVKDGQRSRIEWVAAADVQAEERSWRQQDAPAQNRILTALASCASSLTLSQLGTMTGIERDSLWVLLTTLKRKGLVANPERGRWALDHASVRVVTGDQLRAEQEARAAEMAGQAAPLVPHESGYGMVEATS